MATVTANGVQNVARGAGAAQWSEAWAGRGQRRADLNSAGSPAEEVDTAWQLGGRWLWRAGEYQTEVRAGWAWAARGQARLCCPLAEAPPLICVGFPQRARLSPVERGAGGSAGYTKSAQ